NTERSKDRWDAVNSITGKSRKNDKVIIDPVTLNAHYASVSCDNNYLPIERKSTCMNSICSISEQEIFYALDHLKQTATGPDGLPSWFLRMAAPGISEPLMHLLSLSLNQSIVPTHWKSACITPV